MGDLQSIIVPVQEALAVFDGRFTDMEAAQRGGLMILQGETGAGKTTFLNTLGLFRRNVLTEHIVGEEDVATALKRIGPTDQPRVLVVEGREALKEVSRESLEAAMHAVNAFVRSNEGYKTLIVWPTNTDDLTRILTEISGAVGGEALVGVDKPAERFAGPPQADYVAIAERTVAARNDGADLAALGISDERAHELANEASTIGRYLALIRRELIANRQIVRSLLPAERFRLWTLVIAANDPEADTAALTRGDYAYADIPRMMRSTNANIVKELETQPERVGILGTTLDARILHLDALTALALARTFGHEQLHDLIQAAGISTQADPNACNRLQASELGVLLSSESRPTRRRRKPRSGTREALQALVTIARRNDGACNWAIGAGLVRCGLVEEFGTEVGLGTTLEYESDLLVVQHGQPIRIEVMWRSSTARADIAQYVLRKLGNYGRAIGLLQ